MEGDSDQGKEERSKEGDEILVYLRRVNTNVGHTKMKGLVMKRRTIAQYRKEQRNQKNI